MKAAPGNWRVTVPQQARQQHVKSLCQIWGAVLNEREAELCEQQCFDASSSYDDYFEQWAKVILGNQKHAAQSRNSQGGFNTPSPIPTPEITPTPTPPPELNTFPPKPDVVTPELRESAQKWLELYFRFADDLAEIQSKNPTVEKHFNQIKQCFDAGPYQTIYSYRTLAQFEVALDSVFRASSHRMKQKLIEELHSMKEHRPEHSIGSGVLDAAFKNQTNGILLEKYRNHPLPNSTEPNTTLGSLLWWERGMSSVTRPVIETDGSDRLIQAFPTDGYEDPGSYSSQVLDMLKEITTVTAYHSFFRKATAHVPLILELKEIRTTDRYLIIDFQTKQRKHSFLPSIPTVPWLNSLLPSITLHNSPLQKQFQYVANEDDVLITHRAFLENATTKMFREAPKTSQIVHLLSCCEEFLSTYVECEID